MSIPSVTFQDLMPYAAGIFQIGIMLFALVLMKHIISKPEYGKFFTSGRDEPDPRQGDDISVPRNVEVFTAESLFTLGTFYKFDEMSRSISPVKPKVRIVRLNQLSVLDPVGLFHLRNIQQICDQKGIRLIFSDVRPRVLKALKEMKAEDVARDQMTFFSFGDALNKAREFL